MLSIGDRHRADTFGFSLYTELRFGTAAPITTRSRSSVGAVDTANGLMAVNNLVFDKKKLTVAQLMAALVADWEGHEDIRKMCPTCSSPPRAKTIACSEELVGLEACQRQGQEFLDALTAPNRLELRSLAVDEENGVSFVEYYHEFEHRQWGRFRQVQVHVQRWLDGKVFGEDIYCGQQAKKQ